MEHRQGGWMQDPSPSVISHLHLLLSVAEKGIEINFQPIPAPQSWYLQNAGSSRLHWEKEPQSPMAWSQGRRVNGAILGIWRLRVWGCGVYGHRMSVPHHHLT